MNKKQALELLIKLEVAQGEHNGRWENEYIQEDSSYRYFDDVTTIADMCGIEYLHGSALDDKIEELRNTTDYVEPYDEYGAEIKQKVENKLINIILGDNDE